MYTYNGLHRRATRMTAANTLFDADAPPRPATDDEPGWNSRGNIYYYDSAWRLCEEREATHWDGSDTLPDGSASFTPTRIVQRVWRPLYIDALIATQADKSNSTVGQKLNNCSYYETGSIIVVVYRRTIRHENARM